MHDTRFVGRPPGRDDVILCDSLSRHENRHMNYSGPAPQCAGPAMPGTPEEQARLGWTLLASIVGAVTIARALPSGDQAHAVLDAVLASVMLSIKDEP